MYCDGRVYCGKFEEDRRHGYGAMVWQDGSRYTGMWSMDGMHGRGELVMSENYAGSTGSYCMDWNNGEGTTPDCQFIWSNGRSKKLASQLHRERIKSHDLQKQRWHLPLIENDFPEDEEQPVAGQSELERLNQLYTSGDQFKIVSSKIKSRNVSTFRR